MAAAIGPVDQVISSPLQRARQTAEAFGQPVTIDDRWIELAYGIYEGVPHADVPSEVWNQWLADSNFVPDGGESLSTLDVRVRGACDELVETFRDRDVVVVSHVSPIKTAVAWALGCGVEIAWRSHLGYASISRIEMRRTPVLMSFNESPTP